MSNFKVGDRIEVVNCSERNLRYYENGLQGVIEKLYEDHCRVLFDNKKYYEKIKHAVDNVWYCNYDQIEKIGVVENE